MALTAIGKPALLTPPFFCRRASTYKREGTHWVRMLAVRTRAPVAKCGTEGGK